MRIEKVRGIEMIRYYKLFDLLNRKGLKRSDLRQVLSSATIAKLGKGEYISGEAIEKICLFLNCQPGDIMEVVTVDMIQPGTSLSIKESAIICGNDACITETEMVAETRPANLSVHESDDLELTSRQGFENDEWDV